MQDSRDSQVSSVIELLKRPVITNKCIFISRKGNKRCDCDIMDVKGKSGNNYYLCFKHYDRNRNRHTIYRFFADQISASLNHSVVSRKKSEKEVINDCEYISSSRNCIEYSHDFLWIILCIVFMLILVFLVFYNASFLNIVKSISFVKR